MPRGDRTGPIGMGAMSGRGLGWCRRADAPGYAVPGYGGGRGGGMGSGRQGWSGGRRGGRGWRNGFFATGQPGWMRWNSGFVAGGPAEPEVEKRALEHQMNALQSELEQVKRRLSDIGAGDSSPSSGT